MDMDMDMDMDINGYLYGYHLWWMSSMMDDG